MIDENTCRGIVRSRDARYDGVFITAVLSTGIYCRPSCPARTPREQNMRFYPSAAAAQSAGFRACKRCRPDATPGSPQWNVRSDTVARAMRLIADGVVDREGVPGLAAALGYSVRQIERLLIEQLGAGPAALAQAARAQTARTLIETTTMTMAEVAFAAGFSSVRSFNEVMAETYALTPTQLRASAAPGTTPAGTVTLRLSYREPFNPSNVFGHLIATAVPGIEEFRAGAYRATLRLPHGHGIAALRPPVDGAVPLTLRLTDMRDLPAAVARCRRLLDLDSDPQAVDDALAHDPALRPLVLAGPGRRVPRSLEPEQFAFRAVIGQQVSTAAARTHAARIVQALGEPVSDPDGSLTHLFPDATVIAEHSSDVPQLLRMPQRRQQTFLHLARALAEGHVELDSGADWHAARHALREIPGVGPWTIESIAMRSLGDPDAFLESDLGVRKAALELGLPESPAQLAKASAAWSPWRAYAVQYLWALTPHPINEIPLEYAS